MSNATNGPEPAMFYSHDNLFSILVLVFTTLVGIPGNALVLWVTGVKMKRTVTTIWFGNLALADITCCLCIPFTIAQLFSTQWLYGPVLCRIIPFTLILNMFTSVFTLVAISVDRCILVVQPVWAQTQRSLRMAWMICLTIWMLSFLLCLPVALYRTTFTIYNITLCTYLPDANMDTITLTRLIFGFLVPLTIISTSYACLAFKIQNTRFSEVSRKTTKVAFGIIVAFFITWAPYHIMGVILMFNESEVVETLDLVSQALAHFNSCINPLLYVFMGKDMKREVWHSIQELMENVFSEDLSKSLAIQRNPVTAGVRPRLKSVRLLRGSAHVKGSMLNFDYKI